MSEEWKVVKSVNVGRELNLNLPLEWTVAVVGVMVKLLFLIQNCFFSDGPDDLQRILTGAGRDALPCWLGVFHPQLCLPLPLQ